MLLRHAWSHAQATNMFFEAVKQNRKALEFQVMTHESTEKSFLKL